MMQQAQEQLKGKTAEELDIEAVDDTEPHVQMVCGSELGGGGGGG